MVMVLVQILEITKKVISKIMDLSIPRGQAIYLLSRSIMKRNYFGTPHKCLANSFHIDQIGNVRSNNTFQWIYIERNDKSCSNSLENINAHVISTNFLMFIQKWTNQIFNLLNMAKTIKFIYIYTTSTLHINASIYVFSN